MFTIYLYEDQPLWEQITFILESLYTAANQEFYYRASRDINGKITIHINKEIK